MNIQEAIDERERQIRFLQQEIKSLQVAAEILKGKIPTDKPKTQPEMAYAVLEDVGKPMHVAQVVAQIKRKFSVNIKANNLGVMLFRYSKRGKRFYKVQGRKNTYGLIKWQELSERVEAAKTRSMDAITPSA
jgi:hypothetical protein